MLPNNNPYQILQLNPNNITIDEVRTQYRKMALLYHPDKYKGSDVLFNQVKEAYHEICNQLEGKTNTYVYHELKNNYQQFKEQIQDTKNSFLEPSNTNPENNQPQNLTPNSENKFDLAKFNKKFVQEHNSDIPINLTDDDFKAHPQLFFQNKQAIESDLVNINNNMFKHNVFDRNIFNRQFEHVNGNKETRSKELAKLEQNCDPIPIWTTDLDKYSSNFNTKNNNNRTKTDSIVDNGHNIGNNFELLTQIEPMHQNPNQIDLNLSDQFDKEPDITVQLLDHNYQQILTQKIKEYKDRNILILSQKAKSFINN